MSLTQSYIDEHLRGIHNWDSWGRAIFEQALNEARRKVGQNSADVIELGAIVRITPVPAPGTFGEESKGIPLCIRVEVEIGSSNKIGIDWHNKTWHGSHDI